MVAQAKISETTNDSSQRSNGCAELPTQAVARNTAEFLHDLATLAELQGRLAVVECREGLAGLFWPLGAIGLGVAVALGCAPIALTALALVLADTTTLTYAACFGIALAVGIVLASALTAPAYFALRKGIHMFDRSLAEWQRNRRWAKDTLKRLGQTAPASRWPSDGRR
jgi:hypothetical protein